MNVRIYFHWSKSSSRNEEAHFRDIKEREIRGLSWSKYIGEEEGGEGSNNFKISILALWVNGDALVGTKIFKGQQIFIYVCSHIAHFSCCKVRLYNYFLSVSYEQKQYVSLLGAKITWGGNTLDLSSLTLMTVEL